MPSLFGIDIAAEVASGIAGAGGVLDATLIKVTPGARIGGNLAGGTNPTTTSHACKGFMEKQDQTSGGSFLEITPGNLTREERRTVYILGASIADGAVPLGGDRVTIEGGTYQVVQVSRDPAGAVYTLTVRGA